MSIHVRAAQPGDVEAIAAGNIAMALEAEHKHLDPPTVRRGVQAVFDTPGHGCYFIAESGGRIVGQAMYTYEWSDWRNGVFWWFQSVYVTPDARRRGVFRALYRHIEGLAKADPNVCGLRLYVERDNARAQETYVRCGMRDAGYLVMEVDMSGAVRSARGG